VSRYLLLPLLPGLLALTLLTGCDYLIPQGASTPEIAVWRDFDQEHFLVTVTYTTIKVEDGTSIYVKNGKRANRAFSCDTPDAQGVAVASELPDESLEVRMVYFNPQDSRLVTFTKTYRSPRDEHLFPPSHSFGTIAYPPPKGLFRVGMLEADMTMLPWASTNVALQGEDSEIGPKIYHYRSDNPNLPELLVTVYKGKVTEVDGGAEQTNGSSYYDSNSTPTPSTDSNSTKSKDSSWTGWLFDLLFKR
jgi:hypothetical protein